jgi:hypothetical protein
VLTRRNDRVDDHDHQVMANVEVLVGNAPTSTSSKDERSDAERFGYLVRRGDQVEWHRDGYAERWALPGRRSGGLPVLTTVRVSTGKVPAPRKLARPGRVHVPEFTLDGADVIVGRPVDAPTKRWPHRLRVAGYALAAILILVLAVVAFFAGGDGNTGMGGGVRTELRLWLLDAEGTLMAVSGGCSTGLRSRFFPESVLDRLRSLGIRIV